MSHTKSIVHLSSAEIRAAIRELAEYVRLSYPGPWPVSIAPARPDDSVACAMAEMLHPEHFKAIESPVRAPYVLMTIGDNGPEVDSVAKRTSASVVLQLFVSNADNGMTFILPWKDGPAYQSAQPSAAGSVRNLLTVLGENPDRGGLLETPARVASAWSDYWMSGYGMDPADVLKVFEDGGEGYDEMVAVVDIPVYSHCEHHMAAIFGTATVAYIPDGRIVGLSKISRLVDIYARRLQVQERLTVQIADALQEHLKPKGVGVLIRARHMCMESRGICQQGHHTVTSALRGVIAEKPEARSEFLALGRN